jgi:putative hemolysin
LAIPSFKKGGIFVTASNSPDSQELNLDVNIPNPFLAKLYKIVKRPIEHTLRLKEIRSVYRRSAGADSGRLFLERALSVFQITREIGEGDLEHIPLEGPVILVSNHPFGVVDPMAVLSTVLTVRPDAMVMGNSLLWRIRELRDVLVPVNPFGGNEATRENLRSMRNCIRILKKGRLICLFPSGTVSHIHFRKGRIAITDPPWNPIAARLATMTGATVIPAHVSGRNSALFQIVGLLHPILRTALLPRETVRMTRGHLRIRIGVPVTAERLKKLSSDEERIGYLRSRTYLLAGDRKTRTLPFRKKSPGVPLKPLAPPQPEESILEEIKSIPQEQILVDMKPFRVFQARSDQIPCLFKEIARLREMTFREEDEGTGEPMDMDRFDAYYRHLVLWNNEKNEIAGAYRMGLSEEILPHYGIRGLYTHTLFHFGRRFISRITPAIEMGRSFVTSEYQKSYQPLFLLWKGLARFISANPEYRNLFGPVSITQAYQGTSRQLMAAFLRENNQITELARLVRPRKPFRKRLAKFPELRTAVDNLQDIRELSELVSGLEHDRKGVPVLIRQYLRLGGVVLGFNVDADFRDALDALVLVDLTQTPLKTLTKYMGREESRAFLRYHTSEDVASYA